VRAILSAMTDETTSGGDPTIEPDTKDWTWVLERPCPDCGFDSRAVRPEEVKNRLYANASAWRRVLERDDASRRPEPGTWSPLEYACHVRDVHRVFGERVRMLLAVDDPLFDNWDQDVAAVEGHYGAQDPASVADELVHAAAAVSRSYGSVEGLQWERPGRRSNGSVFTVDTLSRYHLHDVEHHLHDVS
jgi:hypothetical protein